MRNTSDLVQEMLKEAKKAWLVAIAVGLREETKFVFSSRKDPLKELNQLVHNGGFPIGLLRFEKEKTAVQGSYRPFKEYEHEPWAGEYLDGLLENTEDIIALSREQNLPDY